MPKKYKKLCKFCNDPFETNVNLALYCSQLCGTRQRRNNNPTPKTIIKCKFCGDEFPRKANKHNTCVKCKESGSLGVKISGTSTTMRENSNNENDMISAFLKKARNV